MSDSAPAAVFLSYAREDTDAARRIADALRGFGVEVWFDQSELRGGDSWDQKIKKQIRECSLFVAVVSATTQARGEGYFRREWKLAVERTQDMSASRAFLLPVVIDDTPESRAEVPEEFMRVQWTRLSKGAPTPQFVEQIKRLLEAPRQAASAARPASGAAPAPAPRPSGFPMGLAAVVGVVVLGAIAYFALRPTVKEPSTPPKPVVETKTASAPTPVAPAVPLAPDKSIAVLPFANMSPDKDNEFFADGVHEDVITNLAKIRDLKVISRTSVLAYRDPASRNLKKIAAELGVATVLEGSVRRAGTKVRVTAQLIDARTDEHLWAETYDRDLTDVFTIQSALAQEIANALKANLTTGERALIATRLTKNPEAYDLYLRARVTYEAISQNTVRTRDNIARTISLYEEAVAKDPAFAAAYAQLAYLHGRMYWFGYLDPTPARRERAKAARDAALRLAPDLPDTQIAVGAFAYYCDNDWGRALTEYRAAEARIPNDAQVTYFLGTVHRRLGRWSEAQAYLARALELNPRDLLVASQEMLLLEQMRHYPALRDLAVRTLSFFPGDSNALLYLADAQFELDHDAAAYFRARDAVPVVGATDPEGAVNFYQIAMLRGDFAAADRALTNAKLTGVSSSRGILVSPVTQHRALVALLRGQTDATRAFAEEALLYYSSQSWTPRQTAAVMAHTALSHALAGHGDEAVKLARDARAREASFDVSSLTSILPVVAQVYLVLDRRDDAFAVLREMMTGLADTTNELLRLDPLWKRVKDDPRFEEILKLAKPL